MHSLIMINVMRNSHFCAVFFLHSFRMSLSHFFRNKIIHQSGCISSMDGMKRKKKLSIIPSLKEQKYFNNNYYGGIFSHLIHFTLE